MSINDTNSLIPVGIILKSPFLESAFLLPIASILPASSCPGIGCLCFLRPNIIRTPIQYREGNEPLLRAITPPAVTVVANILINTSLFLGVGFATS
ncbi:MAG: hypothetical protein ACFFB2_09120 [Promethearchaeota archaeon]